MQIEYKIIITSKRHQDNRLKFKVAAFVVHRALAKIGFSSKVKVIKETF
jgi:hypothetical protein